MEVEEKLKADIEKIEKEETLGNMDTWKERGVIDGKKLNISAINHYLYYSRKHLPHIYLGVSSVAYHLLTYKHEYYRRK